MTPATGLEKDLAIITHAPVASRLDYCNTLYMVLPLETSQTLQLMQNVAARMLVGTNKYDHVTPILWELHWMPIVFQAQFKLLVLIFKALKVWDQDT